MGLIRPRTVFNVALDGRTTFVVAGAVLGVGIYGFALTFKPYESNRVLEPFPLLEPVVAVIESPVFDPPSAVLPEAAAAPTVEAEMPSAPVEAEVRPVRVAVASAAPAPRAPSAPVVPADVPVTAAAPEPADPVAPEPVRASGPKELPPIEIAPENVLVFIHPGADATDDPAPTPPPDAGPIGQPSEQPGGAAGAGDDDDDDDDGKSNPRAERGASGERERDRGGDRDRRDDD